MAIVRELLQIRRAGKRTEQSLTGLSSSTLAAAISFYAAASIPSSNVAQYSATTEGLKAQSGRNGNQGSAMNERITARPSKVPPTMAGMCHEADSRTAQRCVQRYRFRRFSAVVATTRAGPVTCRQPVRAAPHSGEILCGPGRLTGRSAFGWALV